MGQPRTRKKTVVVLSSDDEDDNDKSSVSSSEPNHEAEQSRALRSRDTNVMVSEKTSKVKSLPVRTHQKLVLSQTPSLDSAPEVSSQKAKREARAKPVNSRLKPKANTTYSFNAATQRQQSSQRSVSPEKLDVGNSTKEEDFIQDDSLDEGLLRLPETKVFSTALVLKKRTRTPLSDNSGIAETDDLTNASQKYRKTSGGARVPVAQSLPASVDSDTRPWTEKFGPLNLDELATHARKVRDVRTWLESVFDSGTDYGKRLLLLKGDAGSGKTTTIDLLSKDLGFNIMEWKNPVDSDFSSESFVSASLQFEEFISRTGRFGGLTLVGGDGNMVLDGEANLAGNSTSDGKKVILIEEFPNTFNRTSTVLQSFRSVILQYLAANMSSRPMSISGHDAVGQQVTPIVMIISETLQSANTASADSFTAHRLLGPEILNHPAVSVIEFNAIAPTLLTKALELVVLKEARISGRRKTPGPQVLKRLAEVGDIRSAISSLEFLCLRGDDNDDWGGKITFAKKKKASKDMPGLTKMERESLEMVTQRESSLGIFHAVGKVVYNKREEPLTIAPLDSIPQPPNHLPQHRRPKASEVNVDALIDEIGTDTSTFIAALHENYVLSCQSSTSEETIECITDCIDALSDADLLGPERFGSRNISGSATDSLRQDEMGFQAGVRGLIFHLPFPVKRKAPKWGGKGNAHRMFYPTFLKLWRQREEIEGLVDLFVVKAQKGQLIDPSGSAPSTSATKLGSVETWKRNSTFTVALGPASQPANSLIGSGQEGAEDSTAEPIDVLLTTGASARAEMLLERLPYLSSILQQKRTQSPALAATLRDIEKITHFTSIGTGLQDETDDHPDAGPALAGAHWATDRYNTLPTKPTRRDRHSTVKAKQELEDGGSRIPVEREVERLVLVDDDIEDD
ncbi:Rad17 cell cycle checkpoint protein-domain-containing protein [Cryomyces antarcticus]